VLPNLNSHSLSIAHVPREAQKKISKASLEVAFVRTTAGEKQTRGLRINKQYEAEKKFLETIHGEAHDRLEELCRLNWKPVECMLRYYGIGYPQQTRQAICAYASRTLTNLFSTIHGIVHYLNPEFRNNATSHMIARRIANRVDRFHKQEQQRTEHMRFATTLPEFALCSDVLINKYSKRWYSALPTILAAKKSGLLDQLAHHHPRTYQALVLRFGLSADEGQLSSPLTLTKVGKALGNLTRERVRQIVREGLHMLRISQVPPPHSKTLPPPLDDESAATLERLTRMVYNQLKLSRKTTRAHQYPAAYRLIVYLLHTFYNWPFLQICSALGSKKLKTIKRVYAEVNRLVERKKYAKRLKADLASLHASLRQHHNGSV
jgi:hypothetical protein